jgi:hypothetical protein
MLKRKGRSIGFYFVFLIGVAILFSGISVNGYGSEKLTITLYQNGPAVVVKRDEVEFGAGTSELIRSVPAKALSGTIFVDSPGRSLKALKIEPPITNEKELLEGLIGKRLEVSENGFDQGRVAGELIDVLNGNPLLKTDSGEKRLIRHPDGYSFKDVTARKNKRLIMEFSQGSEGQVPVTFGYQVGGLTWGPKYVGFLDEGEKELRFRGIAHLSNDTGWNYPDARVYLLAGNPKRESEQPKLFAAKNAAEVQKSGREKVFEYYRYEVGFPVDLNTRTELRVPFVAEREVDYRRYYKYEPAVSSAIRTFLVLVNEKEKGLGVPLAAGTVRIYQDSRERTLLGEDQLPNLPEGEEAELELGKSFDLEGERKVLEHHKLDEDSWRDRVQLKLTNRKDEPVKVRVLERLPGSWDVTRSSHRYENYDSRRILFEVEVEEKSSLEIDYTVKYKY